MLQTPAQPAQTARVSGMPAPAAARATQFAGARWLERWNRWWNSLSPARQDRLVSVVPLVSVLLFLAAIASAFTYFTQLEAQREQQMVMRDVEYAQQRLRLRLLEPHDALQGLALQLQTPRALAAPDFAAQAEMLVGQFPELLAISWLDADNLVRASFAAALAPAYLNRSVGQPISDPRLIDALELMRRTQQSTYSAPLGGLGHQARMAWLLPLPSPGQGALLVEYSLDLLLRLGVPGDVRTRYAVALVDWNSTVLAGSVHEPGMRRLLDQPWTPQPRSHQLAVAPIGPQLLLRATGYRIARDAVGEGFFWVVGSLSLLTVWMLLTNWRHTRRRLQAQRALLVETYFRRAMENSMLTGMRALDLKGRISYVNPAFCAMTGWSESELIGTEAPFPYWPTQEHATLMRRLEEELNGRSSPNGFEVPVQRKDGSSFHARMYVSPLIDSHGQQTGWMTSIHDISEPKRVREALSAAQQRFTTVLDTLDQAISVAPLNSSELLFANRMYQTWFGSTADGHRNLLDLSQRSPSSQRADSADPSGALLGLPTDVVLEAATDSAELFIESLNQWLEVRTRYLTWVDGRLVQMVIASDITARRRAEQQAALQQERAEAASRLITMGEMASSVAHELNQPLTAISNYSSGMIARLQQQQISPEELLQALEKTAKQAQRAGQIIQRIRAFVKRSEPNPTPSDVAQMVGDAVELAELDLRRQLVRLNTYVAARLPRLRVDPILIEQVLINLLKNAGEAIVLAQRPVGQRKVELRVVPRQLDGQSVVEFTVRDNGRGVPPAQIDRIYEAFYSTKSEGMGIGLKLCRSIVESHAGRMQARNLYNGNEVEGCEFSFWIPVCATLQQPLP